MLAFHLWFSKVVQYGIQDIMHAYCVSLIPKYFRLSTAGRFYSWKGKVLTLQNELFLAHVSSESY